LVLGAHFVAEGDRNGALQVESRDLLGEPSMRAACRRRVGAALAISVLSTAVLAGCRSRLRGIAPAGDAPLGEAGPVPVEPATRVPPDAADADSLIRGRILDESGPPPAATVYVLRWKGDPGEEGPVTDAVSTVTANANGEFAFPWTNSTSDSLRIDVAGLAPRRVWLPVTPTRSPILMLGTRALEGSVRDPEGHAVAGALVRVFVFPEKGIHGDEGTGHLIVGRSRSDGSYRFDRLPGGRYRITVEGAASDGGTWFEEEYRTLSGPERLGRADLGSPTRLARVTVRVLAAPGGDLRAVSAVIFRSSSGRRRVARANPDGTYAVRLPPGSYDAGMAVSVESDGVTREGEAALHDAHGQPATLTIRPDAPEPTFDLYLPAK